VVERAAETERVVAIVEATCRVIGREGPSGLRMEGVAQEAGVSKALVHYYFATRRDLLRAAFLHSEEQANARLESELALLETGAERLERFLVLDLDDEPVFHENRALWSEAWSLMRLDDGLRPEVERLYRAWVGRLTELVEEGQVDGSVPASVVPGRLAARLGALLDGLESQLLIEVVSAQEAADIVRESIALELGRAGQVSGANQRGHIGVS
jgi:AcrR family transcriptional regulator